MRPIGKSSEVIIRKKNTNERAIETEHKLVEHNKTPRRNQTRARVKRNAPLYPANPPHPPSVRHEVVCLTWGRYATLAFASTWVPLPLRSAQLSPRAFRRRFRVPKGATTRQNLPGGTSASDVTNQHHHFALLPQAPHTACGRGRPCSKSPYYSSVRIPCVVIMAAASIRAAEAHQKPCGPAAGSPANERIKTSENTATGK